MNYMRGLRQWAITLSSGKSQHTAAAIPDHSTSRTASQRGPGFVLCVAACIQDVCRQVYHVDCMKNAVSSRWKTANLSVE